MSSVQGKNIALSAGGLDSELRSQGSSLGQVEELMSQLATVLLDVPCRLSFGGVLATPGQHLTDRLLEAGRRASSSSGNASPPLTNYSAWPYYKKIEAEFKDEWKGICEFQEVDPAGVTRQDLSSVSPPRSSVLTANALSAMRETIALSVDVMIVWGGRIQGAAGWMPGIMEEVGFALQYGKPVILLGGFGGCAGLIAGFLRETSAPWPDSLRVSPELSEQAEARDQASRFAHFQDLLRLHRQSLHQSETLGRIPTALLREALQVGEPAGAVRLVVDGIQSV